MQDRPQLPVRTPANRAIGATLRLWHESQCNDIDTMKRVASGLRRLGDPAGYQSRAQDEVDRVIARYRAAHPRQKAKHDS